MKCRKKIAEVIEVARIKNESAINAEPSRQTERKGRERKRGFFAEDIRNTFGLLVEGHNKSHEVTEIDDFTLMIMLTGNTPPKEIKTT